MFRDSYDVAETERVSRPLIFGLVLLLLSGLAFWNPLRSNAATGLTTVASGAWSNPATWSGGRVPGAGDSVTIVGGHEVVYDLPSSKVNGVTIQAGATLHFDPARTASLDSSANVIVEGALRMHPAAEAVVHTLRFVDIVEAKFVGDGMDPLDSDVGLWVMGAGTLDTAGSTQSPWSRVAGAAAAGATSLTLEAAPTGWAPGDEIVVAPTQAPAGTDPASYDGFDERIVTAVSGVTITVDRPLSYAHPTVPNPYDGGVFRAEVLNLTRNVRIEGQDATHRSHIFIRSTSPQSIINTAVRYMGPHHDPDGDGVAQPVVGRYGIHFHMNSRQVSHQLSNDQYQRVVIDQPLPNSNGSVVDGTVVRDTGSHVFVPHESDGVTFRNSISYNTQGAGFWWDRREVDSQGRAIPGSESNNTLVTHCVIARVTNPTEKEEPRLSGFHLGRGTNNTVEHSVAVGIDGGKDSSGFHWPEGDFGVWNFHQSNLAHNNAADGIFVWQNSPFAHSIENFAAYHNAGFGIDHGAYGNSYRYAASTLYGNLSGAVNLQAVSKAPSVENGTGQLTFEDIIMDGGGLSASLVLTDQHNALPTETPTVFRRVALSGNTDAAKSVHLASSGSLDLVDFMYSDIQNNEIYVDSSVVKGSVVRVQNATGTPYQLNESSAQTSNGYATRTDNVSPFATGGATGTPGAAGPWVIPGVTVQPAPTTPPPAPDPTTTTTAPPATATTVPGPTTTAPATTTTTAPATTTTTAPAPTTSTTAPVPTSSNTELRRLCRQLQQSGQVNRDPRCRYFTG